MLQSSTLAKKILRNKIFRNVSDTEAKFFI